MNKFRIRRGDIWMAGLRSAEGDVLRGEHPVIVVSTDRNNRRSRIITVVPLTSAAKPPMPCHVSVSGFGLRKESIALAEQITTLPKDCLRIRVGSLVGSRELEKLEQAIRRQLEVA